MKLCVSSKMDHIYMSVKYQSSNYNGVIVAIFLNLAEKLNISVFVNHTNIDFTVWAMDTCSLPKMHSGQIDLNTIEQ